MAPLLTSCLQALRPCLSPRELPASAEQQLPRQPRRHAAWSALALCASALWLTVTTCRATESVVQSIEQQFRRGESRQALVKLDQALAAQPADAELRFLKAVILADAGQLAEAEALLTQLTQEFPDLPEPFNNLAVLQAGKGQLESALALLQTALQLDPGYSRAHQNRGDLLVRLALRAYQAAATGVRGDTELENKLRLTRELTASRANAQAPN